MGGLKYNVTSAIFIIMILMVVSAILLTPMMSMVVLGAIFAYAIRPLSRRLEPYTKFESIAIFVGMIIVIFPLIIILLIFINTIISAAPSLIIFVKNLNLSSLNSTTLQNYPLFQQYFPASTSSQMINSIVNSIYVGMGDVVRSVTEYLLGLVQSIPTLLLQLFIFFASTFYFARDGDKIWEYMNYIIPEERKHYFKTLIKEIDLVLKSIFFGHFVTAALTGVIAGFGFWIMGYPYPLFLGTLTGFFQLMPIVGHWPTLVALALYDLVIGNFLRAAEVLSLGVLLSLMDMYVRPKVAGKYADIHPLIFLLGFICGPLILGIVGFIIGPLVLGVTYAAVVAYKKENQDKNPEKLIESKDTEKKEGSN